VRRSQPNNADDVAHVGHYHVVASRRAHESRLTPLRALLEGEPRAGARTSRAWPA
jgi:hypothetical protein